MSTKKTTTTTAAMTSHTIWATSAYVRWKWGVRMGGGLQAMLNAQTRVVNLNQNYQQTSFCDSLFLRCLLSTKILDFASIHFRNAYMTFFHAK